MRLRDEAEFKEYVAAQSLALRRTAYLMCGDWHQAEDLVQTALLRLYRSWSKVQRSDSRDAYVRQVLVRCLIDERRRGWRRERPFAEMPEVGPHMRDEDGDPFPFTLDQMATAVSVEQFVSPTVLEEMRPLPVGPVRTSPGSPPSGSRG